METKFSNVVEMFEKKIPKSSISEEMLTWQPAWVAKFFLSHPQYQKKLLKAEFDEFWHTRLTNLNIASAPKFKFMSQTGVRDAELFLGYVCYLLAIKNKADGKQEDYLFYLTQAMTHYSINAHSSCLHELMKNKSSELDKNLNDIATLLQNWEKFAHIHGAPGYLLLAKGYLHIASQLSITEEKERVEAAFYLVWKYLHLAKLAEPYCNASINNAYFGCGLALSNAFEFNSIDEMQLGCSTLAGKLSIDLRQYQSEADAKRTFANLSVSFKSPGWTLAIPRESRDTLQDNATATKVSLNPD